MFLHLLAITWKNFNKQRFSHFWKEILYARVWLEIKFRSKEKNKNAFFSERKLTNTRRMSWAKESSSFAKPPGGFFYSKTTHVSLALP